jgi:bifunctional DNA-binding transcriptional regulator/antitoxin component of YhaV-PrlF toxin-antitoxin module
MPGYNRTHAVTGNCSLTLLFPKCIAEVLGIRNGDTLRWNVDGKRLIIERDYSGELTGGMIVSEEEH